MTAPPPMAPSAPGLALGGLLDGGGMLAPIPAGQPSLTPALTPQINSDQTPSQEAPGEQFFIPVCTP